jgi:hypothetical protein
MRRLFPIAVAMIFATPAAAQTVPSPGALAAQENSVWQAIADHRPDNFAAFLERDYVGVYEDGFKTVAQEVEDVRALNLTRFQISDFVARTVDANNVVVTYQVDMSGSVQGQNFAGRFNVASYWHRNGRQWRVRLHSQTPIGH